DREISIPCGRQLAPLHLVDLGREIRMRGAIRIEQVRPLAARLSAARPDPSCKMVTDPAGNQELRILGPPVGALGQSDLRLAERLPREGGRILQVGRAIADMAVQNDEGRAVLRLLKYAESVIDEIDVV